MKEKIAVDRNSNCYFFNMTVFEGYGHEKKLSHMNLQ